MPESTMTHEDEWKLPADTPLPAVLNSVEEKEIKYTRDGKEKSFTKWDWEFEVTEGDYAGLRAWGSTEDRLTNHPENRVRQWAETLRGQAFELGEGFATDDVLGLSCLIVVANDIHEKKGTGEKSYICPVIDIYPVDSQVEEPPF